MFCSCGCGKEFIPSRQDHRFATRACQLKGRRKTVGMKPPVHLVIPDTQAKRGVPNDHLRWIGQYIVDQFSGDPLTVIHVGDHWDMPSLSSYDKGKKVMEGRRYKQDIEAGNRAFDLLNEPLHAETDRTGWMPRRVFLLGNHENRINRAVECDATLDGLLSTDQLNAANHGWEVHEFLEPVTVDGVVYCHYFYNPMTGRPYSGENPQLRLKNLGHSFTMGHQQTLQYGIRYVNGRSQHALIAGAAYQHEEIYLGPQGNSHWRGIVVCHQVEEGSYDPMMVSLDYLCRKYEGHRLEDHRGKEL